MSLRNNPQIQTIENNVDKIKNRDYEAGCNDLGNALSSFLKTKINVRVVPAKTSKQFFAMCVIPEDATISKIVSAIALNKGSVSVISSLWKKNKSWRLEIDEKIITGDFTTKEITAMVLHECGHVTQTNSVPMRISNIVQFGVAKSSLDDSSALKSKVFSKFLEIPIIQACTASDANNIKKELKADKFAVKCGYENAIVSAITKLERIAGANTKTDTLSKATDFSLDASKALQQRKVNLVKTGTAGLLERLPMNYMRESVYEICEILLQPDEKIYELTESFIDWGNGIESSNTFCYNEFFNIGKKKLNPIRQREIDYIEANLIDLENHTDKLMLLSYTNSKLELCQYYLEIYNHPEIAKKYVIPNTKPQLIAFQKRLLLLKDAIIKKDVTDKQTIEVYYPAGYEG